MGMWIDRDKLKLKANEKTAINGLPGASIVEHTGRVDALEEPLGDPLVLRHHHLGVAGPVLVHVLDGLLDVVNDLDGAGEVAVLEAQLFSLKKYQD